MSATRLKLEIALARLGVGPWVMAVVLGVSLVAVAVHLVRLSHETAQLNAQLESLRYRADVPAEHAVDANAARLRAFHEVLGSRAAMDDHLQSILRTAAQMGLRIEQGEYRWTRQRPGGYDQYQVAMPVQGEPHAIQRFATQLLVDFPFVALEDISVQHKAGQAAWSVGGQQTVQARLRLVFFLRDEGLPQ